MTGLKQAALSDLQGPLFPPPVTALLHGGGPWPHSHRWGPLRWLTDNLKHRCWHQIDFVSLSKPISAAQCQLLTRQSLKSMPIKTSCNNCYDRNCYVAFIKAASTEVGTSSKPYNNSMRKIPLSSPFYMQKQKVKVTKWASGKGWTKAPICV